MEFSPKYIRSSSSLIQIFKLVFVSKAFPVEKDRKYVFLLKQNYTELSMILPIQIQDYGVFA